MHYFRLTDTVNYNAVLRVEKAQQEIYNTGTAQWEPTPLFILYNQPGNIFEGLYEEITKEQAEAIILSNKNEWVRYWNIVLQLISKQYKTLPSPIQDVMYSDYIPCIADLASNARERVLLGLSGLPLLPNWKSIAAKNNFPKLILNALSLWHTTEPDIHRASNQYVLTARLKEVTYLVSRNDLIDQNKYRSLYSKLTTAYSTEELYANLKDWR